MTADAKTVSGAAQPPRQTDAAPSHYTTLAKLFHWVIAAMIVLQFVLSKLSEWAEDDGERLRQLGLLANHKSVGMTVLVLAAARLIWRVANRPPALPPAIPNWQKMCSNATHVALYALLFAMPISGWLMSSAATYNVSWFGLFTWPNLVGPSQSLVDLTKTIHDWLGKGLFAIAALHIAAALKHHFIDKDTVLKRMSSFLSLSLFALIIGAGTTALTDVGGGARKASADTATTAPADASAETEAATNSNAGASDLPLWTIDKDASVIRFTAEQAGAAFTGEWQTWSADMRFDAAALDASQFDVTITIAGVETNDAERNATLQDSDWFDASAHPAVRFQTQRILQTQSGYMADATLTVKGQNHPVPFSFTVAEQDGVVVLDGTSRLDRLALGIGTGDWTDTEWVGQFVDVSVRVTASVE
ncbi:MAG: cytochrome b/b6 domain-containing protein [Pseudomonadota bacterium]